MMDIWQDENFIICPHCGEMIDPGFIDFEEEAGEQKCTSCGETFNLQVETITTYTSTKINE